MHERRRHARIAFNVSAELIAADHRAATEIYDLSLKGALVRLPAGVDAVEQTDCRLRVHLSNTQTGIDMEARVAHVEGRYAGLTCLSIDLDSVTHLRRLVELNLGDPALLERELSALIAD